MVYQAEGALGRVIGAAKELSELEPKGRGAVRACVSVAVRPRPPPVRRPGGSSGNFLLTFRPVWPKRLSRMSMIATGLISLEMTALRASRVARWRAAGTASAAWGEVRA